MITQKPEPIQNVKAVFNDLSSAFDELIEVFERKVYAKVTWEHLSKYIPQDKPAKVLDAGGGTGRWTIPLAKMGYQVVLCDISSGMLDKAKAKLKSEKLLDRVNIIEADIADLPLPDVEFDFVLCEDGPLSIADHLKTIRELVRVVKRGGKVWAAVIGRLPLAVRVLRDDPPKGLKLYKGDLNYTFYKKINNCRIYGIEELKRLFEENGLDVINIFGNRIITYELPEELQYSKEYDEDLFKDISDLELKLSTDQLALPRAEYIQIVGIKRV